MRKKYIGLTIDSIQGVTNTIQAYINSVSNKINAIIACIFCKKRLKQKSPISNLIWHILEPVDHPVYIDNKNISNSTHYTGLYN